MSKPFRLADTPPDTTTASPARDSQGRFTQQLVAPAPPQVAARSYNEGKPITQVIAEVRVPDHLLTDTSKAPGGGYREQSPWPQAGPVNDGNHKPMRLT